MSEKEKKIEFEALLFGTLLALTGSLWLWFSIMILTTTEHSGIGGTLAILGNTLWVLGFTATFWYAGFKEKT